MCERDDGTRHWRLYVQDMIEFAEKALLYTDGMSLSEFLDDSRSSSISAISSRHIGAAFHVFAAIQNPDESALFERVIRLTRRLAARRFPPVEDAALGV